MTLRHSFTIPERCRTKARPRLGRGRKAYTPQATTEAEGRVRQAYRDSEGPTFEGNVGVKIEFYGDHTDVELWELDGGKAFLPGDTDNYVKLVLDGLQPKSGTEKFSAGVAFPDDKQVLHINATRMVR